MSNRNVTALLENAKHESVNEKRLTKLKGGLTSRYLNDEPLIEYLHEGEQPNFIFVARQNAPKFSGPNPPSWRGDTLTAGMAMHMITNDRWVMVAGMKGGDESFEVSLRNVKVTDYQTGRMKHEISIEAGEYRIDTPIANVHDSEDIKAAVDYIRAFESSDTEEVDLENGKEKREEEDLEDLQDRWRHETVNEKRLTNLEIGTGTGDYELSGVHLFDKTLSEYIHENENPRFILAARKTAPEISGPNRPIWSGDKLAGMAMHLVTDSRWLIVVGKRGGDGTFEIDLEDITSIEYSTGYAGHKIKISTDSNNITVPISNIYGENILRLTTQYIRKPSEFEPRNYESIRIDSMTCGKPQAKEPKRDQGEESHKPERESYDNNIPKKHGDYVTIERVDKIRDVLDEDEKVHYLTSGSTIDVEGSSAGESLFGDDRSRKSGTSGWVRAGITDRRVVVKVPQWLGNDERSIPYQNITSIDLDTGFVNKRLSLQTPGQTYHIEAQQPLKEEIRDAVKFIRNKITESQDEQVVVQSNDEPDPTEQLQNLKELHEEGVLTDAEFEEKKQSLLDKI